MLYHGTAATAIRVYTNVHTFIYDRIDINSMGKTLPILYHNYQFMRVILYTFRIHSVHILCLLLKDYTLFR